MLTSKMTSIFLSSRNSSRISVSNSSAVGGFGFVSKVSSSLPSAKSSILLTAYISKKMAEAMMIKLMIAVMKLPHAITGATEPRACAGGSYTWPFKGKK